MPVNSKRQDYENIHPQWARLRDCVGGRDAILKGGNRYVPDLPGADAIGNQNYRARGNFYNAVARTVEGMAGAIFQKPPEVAFPDAFVDYLDDITLANVPFETFSSEAGREILLLGRYGLLVDMPTEDGVRPYACAYKAEEIINWRTTRMAGDEILTMVVLHESADVPDEKDSFLCKMVSQYRVLELTATGCTVQLWREATDKSQGYVPFTPPVALVRRGQPLNFIPFVFLGAVSATADMDRPPLIDLCDVNLAHWRNSVDHEYGLHLIALPTPWVAGVKGSSDGTMKIGPSVVWELDAAGSAGMLEFTGAGLASIVTAMDEKKKQMAVLGARLLEESAQVQETASAVRMRHAGEFANLRSIAGVLEVGLTLMLQMMAWWVGLEEKPADVEAGVELNKEYLDVKASAQEVQVALTALQAGEISFETWWNFLTTGGWGREGIDAAAERDSINKQKALAPEPAVDPALSPSDIVPPVPAKTKVITGADGVVKYTITEN